MQMHRASVALKRESSTRHDRISYMVYEVIGTFILCYAYNMIESAYLLQISVDPLVMTLFIVSIIAWDVSACHFNLGVTIAYLIYDISNFKDIWD